MVKPIDELEFKQIKHKLKWSTRSPQLVAIETKRSIATVQRIKSSKDFEEFQALSNAEHPPLKITTIGKKMTRLLSILKAKENLTDDDIKYINIGKR